MDPRPRKQVKNSSILLLVLVLSMFMGAFVIPKVFGANPSYQTTVCLFNGVYSCTVTFHSGVANGDFIVIASSVNWIGNTPSDLQTCNLNLGASSYQINGSAFSFTQSNPMLASGGFHATGGFLGGAYNTNCGVSYQAYATVTQAGTHGLSVLYGQAWTENLNNFGSMNVYDVTGCASVACAFNTLGLNNTFLATTTTVVNTVQGNPQGGNGTFHYGGGGKGGGSTTTRNQLSFYQSQNAAATGLIDNVTIKVGAVHINATRGSLYIVIYQTQPQAIPSAATPFQLIYSSTQTVFNGTTTPYFIHLVPQATICSSCYYAVGVQFATFHSNSATVKGSGVNIEAVSTPTETEMQYNTTKSQTPPTSFFSNSVKPGPYDWIYWHETFTVVTATVTSTSVSAAATVTVTTNQAGVQANANAYIGIAIIATLTLLMAKFAGVAGAIFGAIIGEVVAIAGQFITGPFVTISLGVTVIGALAVVYLGRSSGGGGGI